MSDLPKNDELFSTLDHRPSGGVDWMDTPIDIRPGMYCYSANPKSMETLSAPNVRKWNPMEDDWLLPDNW